MNFRQIGKILGFLVILMGCAMAVCGVYANFWEPELTRSDSIKSFIISALSAWVVGGVLIATGELRSGSLLRKEAIAIVGLGWIISALFGALPYLFIPEPLTFAGALFESMSGLTTTGATVIPDLSQLSRSVLLWRSMSQWLGGLGILVLFVALLSFLGVGSKALFHHESSAKTTEGLQPRINDIAKHLLLIYLMLSAICCIGLHWLGMGWYDAVSHSMTAISTGGFSPKNQSVAFYKNAPIEIWLSLFMILGSISFILYAWAFKGRWKRWKVEEEAKFFLALTFTGTLLIALDLRALNVSSDFWQALRAALFQVASIISTTGYATENYDLWPPFSKTILALMMFIGGCGGSTAGGIKVGRVLLLFKILRSEIIASYRPNQLFPLKLNGNNISESLKRQTLLFITLALMTVALGFLIVSLLEPELNMGTSLSAVIATLFSIGPGFSGVGPTENFAKFSEGTKIAFVLFMALGRLEFFAVLALFTPTLWRRY